MKTSAVHIYSLILLMLSCVTILPGSADSTSTDETNHQNLDRELLNRIEERANRCKGRPSFPPTKRYTGTLPNQLAHQVFTVKIQYRPLERIIVYRRLENISSKPMVICESCYSEGIRLLYAHPTPSDPLCGFFGEHVSGFVPTMKTLDPGEVHEVQVDLTDQPCGFLTYGPGEYAVRSQYCSLGTGRIHECDPPEYIGVRIRHLI